MTIVSKEVIPGDFCIGCGLCTYLEPSRYRIQMDEFGMLKATLLAGDARSENRVDDVCPFSGVGPNEDALSDELFPGVPTQKFLGKSLAAYVGHVDAGGFREAGSSGGLAKWVLYRLLKDQHVDHVIQVAYSGDPNRIYKYTTNSDPEQVIGGSKSAYYPVTLDEILDRIKTNPGRYAITALPCFATGLRRLTRIDPIVRDRVVIVVGIICGHLKSTAFTESLAWQLGVPPGAVASIDFRVKLDGKRANEKGVVVVDQHGLRTHARSSKELFGGNWGHNLFKYKACDYCDDVFAETADCAIGDAWLPGWIDDHRGTSIIVVRNQLLLKLIEDGISRAQLSLQSLSADDARSSQRGGLLHRNEGLSLRLHDDDLANRWRPQKRTQPSAAMSRYRRHIYRTRVLLREASHVAFREAKADADIKRLYSQLNALIARLNHQSVWRRLLTRLVSTLRTQEKA